ncbi:MAG: hypothetical protein PHD67_04000 [Oscillospiraceae bacterium]|nr:hypothetical protein [Oscillospiraceae bacterium]
MKGTFSITLLSLVGAALCAFALAYWGRPPEPAGHPETGIPIESSPSFAPWKYMICEYEGRLAVYCRDEEEPEMVFDVFVHTLPEYDRGALRQGVPAASYEELVALLEDYTS